VVPAPSAAVAGVGFAFIVPTVDAVLFDDPLSRPGGFGLRATSR
jgi:hypothetical protein